jgi:CubicO group peptidase (beta-lactamase class C family)
LRDVTAARTHLRASMAELVERKGMLTGITVCWGTADACAGESLGLAREMIRERGSFREAPLPIHQDTVYDIASLTKLFTLAAALQLVERGKMAFEDDVARLDPRFDALSGCSLLDLLSYEAVLKTPQRVDAQPDVAAAEKQVFFIRRVPEEEGAKLYSDMNALVLKYLVEAVSGKPYYLYLKEHVLGPLNMDETWIKAPEERWACIVDYNYEHRMINGSYKLLDGNFPGLPHDPKAKLLGNGGRDLAGHAGLFSTAGDMCRFAMGLLSGKVISKEVLGQIGINRTGRHEEGRPYRQYMGLICFSKSAVERLSEVPPWMGNKAFALSGYTGNHLAIDPELGVFDLFLGNRCHNRLSVVEPKDGAEALGLMPDGTGDIAWPDGRRVKSSFQYVYQKDALLHAPVRECLLAAGWMQLEEMK